MKEQPIRTTVIGSYPFPSWLELAMKNLDQFGTSDLEEIKEDAVKVAIHDQMAAGLDVISDGEQTRLDFNLSFYGFIDGVKQNSIVPRKWGPPAHDQRGKHQIIGILKAPKGLGVVEEYNRLKVLAPEGVTLKASVPGPFTLSGRLLPNNRYKNRYAITEALIPIVQKELRGLIKAGCKEITIDEPSMSCYAYKSDTKDFVNIFNKTVKPAVGKCRLSTHLCFGNYKGHAVGYRKMAPMFPDFLDFNVDEMHVEMANREFAELYCISMIAEEMDVAVGVIDVKSYYIETVDDVVHRINECLRFVTPDRLSIAPDCGLSQTARWAAKQKLINMVAGANQVRKTL